MGKRARDKVDILWYLFWVADVKHTHWATYRAKVPTEMQL
jgi:hypothetical protein